MYKIYYFWEIALNEKSKNFIQILNMIFSCDFHTFTLLFQSRDPQFSDRFIQDTHLLCIHLLK
jgi:hypothetical protein